MKPMRVLDVIESYLKRENLDGLCNVDADCGCLVNDLAPCGEMSEECLVGRRAPCDCGDHDYHVEEVTCDS